MATGSTESRSSVLCTGEMLRSTILILFGDIDITPAGGLLNQWCCVGSLSVDCRMRCRPVLELRVHDDLGGAIVFSSKVNTSTMRCIN